MLTKDYVFSFFIVQLRESSCDRAPDQARSRRNVNVSVSHCAEDALPRSKTDGLLES